MQLERPYSSRKQLKNDLFCRSWTRSKQLTATPNYKNNVVCLSGTGSIDCGFSRNAGEEDNYVCYMLSL